MSTVTRTIKNFLRIGPLQYGRQLQHIGDTKAGTLIGKDRYGNKFYENMEELPLRTRWVDYKDHEFEASQVEPGWHAWLAYITDEAPVTDAISRAGIREWEPKEHKPMLTMTRSAYKPFSTTKPKYAAWNPVAKPRV